MSKLRHALDDYLALRRSLGYKLEHAGRLLADFVGLNPITRYGRQQERSMKFRF